MDDPQIARPVQAAARFQDGGADSQVATLFRYADGQLATSISALDTLGPNVASIVGTDGRIDIDAVWYSPSDYPIFGLLDRLLAPLPSIGEFFRFRICMVARRRASP